MDLHAAIIAGDHVERSCTDSQACPPLSQTPHQVPRQRLLGEWWPECAGWGLKALPLLAFSSQVAGLGEYCQPRCTRVYVCVCVCVVWSSCRLNRGPAPLSSGPLAMAT